MSRAGLGDGPVREGARKDGGGPPRYVLRWLLAVLVSVVTFGFGPGEGRAAPLDTLAVGFAEGSADAVLVDSAEPMAVFIRAAVGRGLVSLRRATDGQPPPAGFELALADALKVSPDYAEWSLRVRRGAKFHSGRPISASDVVFSLDRCRSRGRLPGVKKTSLRRVKTAANAVEEWVDVSFGGSPSGPKQSGSYPIVAALAECSIWERESAEVFGEDFGVGANFVGAGPYRVGPFKPGRQYSLERVSRAERLEVAGPGEVLVRTFAEPSRGLTALREGTIGVLFTGDRAVRDKAAADETLVAFTCAGFSALRRRSVMLECDPGIAVAHFREVR